MYKYINLSRYSNCNSSIHVLNPIIKIICYILFVVSILFAKDLFFGLIISILLINMILMCNLKLSVFFNFLWKFKYLLLVLFVLMAVNDVLLNNNLLVLIKVILFVMYSFLFVSTTGFDSLLFGISRILYPLKLFGINIYKVSSYIAYIIMFIPSYFEEFYKVYTSILMRSSLSSYMIFIKSIIPAFKNNIIRFKEYMNLINIKHFDLDNKHTNYKFYKLKFNDIFIFAIHIIFIVAIVLKDVVL